MEKEGQRWIERERGRRRERSLYGARNVSLSNGEHRCAPWWDVVHRPMGPDIPSLVYTTDPTHPLDPRKIFSPSFCLPDPERSSTALFDVRGFNLPDHAPPLSCLSHPTPAANPCLPIPYPILYHIYPLYSSKGKRSTRVWFYRYRVRCISTYIFYLSFVFSGSNSNC